MQEEWFLFIREQCEAAAVPYSYKQWGGVHKKAAGRLLLGRTYDDFPESVESNLAGRRAPSAGTGYRERGSDPDLDRLKGELFVASIQVFETRRAAATQHARRVLVSVI